MVKKYCVFRFFTFNFILVCVSSLTKIKRRNHQNVLFYVSIVKLSVRCSINDGLFMILCCKVTKNALNECNFLQKMH